MLDISIKLINSIPQRLEPLKMLKGITVLVSLARFVHDPIHGNIGLSHFAAHIDRSPIFQRLSGLKQLGPCRYIYPTASHTRYEHSLGTYYLAGELIDTIANLENQTEIDSYLKIIPELHDYYERTNTTHNLLTPYVRELVKIAGLCHDIGHGSFSHLYEDKFLAKIDQSNNPNKSHEHRSNLLIDKIIKENEYLRKYVTDNDIAFIKALINPSKNHTGFIFNIVSNSVNGLDVDKYDYLRRDILMVDACAKIDTTMLTKYVRVANNSIIYPIQAFDDIENLFRTRYKMYKQVYLHPSVTSVEYLITEIMVELNNIMELAESINDMDKFITLNDNTITECINIIDRMNITLNETQMVSYNKIRELKNKLDSRNFYLLLSSVTTKNKINAELILEELTFNHCVIYSQHKLGFLSGNKPNPFESIYFFDPTQTPIVNIYTIAQLGHNVPTLDSTGTHQEYVTNFYFNGNDQTMVHEIKDKLNEKLQIETKIIK